MQEIKRRSKGRLTSRDLAILEWIGRHGLVTAPQTARHLGVPTNKAQSRLRVLKANGLLAHRRVLHNEPGVYWAMREGLELAGLDLPVCAIALGTYRHSLTAVDAAFAYESEGLCVLTERELRREQAQGDSRFLLTVSGATHRPDLVALTEAGPAAVEVELTHKGLRRLEAILVAYRGAIAAERIAYLAYLVRDETTRARIAARAAAAFLDKNECRIGLIGKAL